jgi:hypothetical protein
MQGLPMRSNEQNRLEPAFFAQSLKKIRYAMQPPRVKNEWMEMDTHQFAQKCNIKWTDSLLVPPRLRDDVITDSLHEANALIEERLHYPLDCFVVCEMGANLGKGVFLALDAKPLPPGTIVGVYAGKFQLNTPLIKDDYRMSANTQEHLQSKIANETADPSFSAITEGNITRFFQDLPTEVELSKVKNIHQLQLDNIATANLLIMSGTYYGFPISYFVSFREIQPGEEVGFSYEWEWNDNGSPRGIRDINGNVIGCFKNPQEIELNSAFVATKKNVAPRPFPNIFRDIVLPKIANPPYDTFNCDLRFKQNVNHCLNLYTLRSTSLHEKKYIETLTKLFNSIENTQKQFDMLLDLMSRSVPSTLSIMKIELVSYLKKYDTQKSQELLFGKLPITFQFSNLQLEQSNEVKIEEIATPNNRGPQKQKSKK